MNSNTIAKYLTEATRDKRGRLAKLDYKEKVVKSKLDRVTATITDPKNPINALAQQIKDLRDEADEANAKADELLPELREKIDTEIFSEKDAAATRVIELANQLEIVSKKASIYHPKISAEEYEEIIARLLPLISKNLAKAQEMYQEIRSAYVKAPVMGKSAIQIKKQKFAKEQLVAETMFGDFTMWLHNFQHIMSYLFKNFDTISKTISYLLNRFGPTTQE